MSEELTVNNFVENISGDLTPFENNIISLYKSFNLPNEFVLARLDERKVVLNNLKEVIEQIPLETRKKSLYLSKFISATISGLFDAALNYIWNETIFNLRNKVSTYDINYFFDLIIDSTERSKYKSIDDLAKISDYMLIDGALKLEILNEISYKKLDTIRYLRNNISAAHPNKYSVSGLELITYLDICIKNVLLNEPSKILITINKLLKKIKEEQLNDDDVMTIVESYKNFTNDKLENLCQGIFGIYCREDKNEYMKKNIEKLLPPLWNILDVDFKKSMGIIWQSKILNENDFVKKNVYDFLNLVNGKQYLPDDSKIPKIKVLLKQLIEAHNGYNNFYTEGNYINLIKNYIGEVQIPVEIEKLYVDTLTYVFLTNGNGVAWNADSVYRSLISKFSNRQILISLISFKNIETKTKLEYELCKTKFVELINIFKENATDIDLKNILQSNVFGDKNLINADDFAKKLVESAKSILK